MYHRINAKKLNRTSSHRKALLKNMANSLIMHEQIQTTLPKAKALRPYVEKLITFGKQNTLNSKRIIFSKQRDSVVVNKLTDILAKRYESRPGGYTRIVKAGFRYGDRAPMAIIEFIERDITAKGSSANLNLEINNEKNVSKKDTKSKAENSSNQVADKKARKKTIKTDKKLSSNTKSNNKSKGSSVPRKTQGK